MTDALRLILEDDDGTQLETSCTRFAVVWQGKEVWIQQDGRGQLLIGVDVDEDDTEYANLGRLHFQLQADQVGGHRAQQQVGEDDDHVHGPGCGHHH